MEHDVSMQISAQTNKDKILIGFDRQKAALLELGFNYACPHACNCFGGEHA